MKFLFNNSCNTCRNQNEQIVQPYHFERCQWQKNTDGPHLLYLLYRWFLAVMFVAVMLWSICDVRRHPKNGNNLAKWPIFLTSWAFTACTFQGVLALWIVQSAWINQKVRKLKASENSRLPKLYKLYWICHILATVIAFTITTMYWSIVHDAALHRIDALNILLHAVNSIVMFADIFLVMHPCKFIFGLAPLTVGFTYGVFSYIYYIMGGTDRLGNPYVYVPLDWRNPIKSAIVIALSLVGTFVIHCIVYGLFKFRIRMSKPKEVPPSPIFTLQEKSTLLEIA